MKEKVLLTKKRLWTVNLYLSCLLIMTALIVVWIGLPLPDLSATGFSFSPIMHDIFFQARLPRVLLGIVVGAGLSTSGVAFQSLLRNPLADPYILGVSGGAALGAVLALSLGLPFAFVSVIAFFSGLASLFLIYKIARVDGRLPASTLLLTGVIYNAFSFALILLIHSLVSMGESHQILFLLMGSLEAQKLGISLWVGFMVLIGAFVLFWLAPQMNIVSLGEESATQLGLSVDRYRKLIFVAASLMVGACVSVAGLIGFVGLFVPHMMRLLFGTDHRLLLPASAIGGGIFLVICDFMARSLFNVENFQTQVPVGVITALVGGPFFVYLLKKQK